MTHAISVRCEIVDTARPADCLTVILSWTSVTSEVEQTRSFMVMIKVDVLTDEQHCEIKIHDRVIIYLLFVSVVQN